MHRIYVADAVFDNCFDNYLITSTVLFWSHIWFLPGTAAVVRLEIVRSMFCPANKMCAQVMPMPLSVDDPTDITCQTFVAVIPQAQFLTSFYDRLNGGVVKNVSTMQLELIQSTK